MSVASVAVPTQLLRANADLLRRLAAQPEPSIAALGAGLGRDKSNLAKTLKTLERYGLIESDPALALTAAGRIALAALPAPTPTPAPDAFAEQVRRAASESLETPDANGVRALADAGFALIPHQLIAPDGLNPRSTFDDESLCELAASIDAAGLLQNLVVRPAEPMDGYDQPMHRLVAGERRWRAIGILIEDGAWPEDRPVPCQVRVLDDAGHAVAALLENLQRQELKPLEEARAFKRLIDEHGFKTADIAGRIRVTQRMVQQRVQLLDLTPAQQTALEEGRINLEQARQALANRPKPIELTSTQALMFLEVCHWIASQDDEPDFWTHAPRGAIAPDDADAAALRRLNLIDDRTNWKTGDVSVGLHYVARRALEQLTGSDELALATIAPALAAAVLAAAGETGGVPGLGATPGGYATPWLNPPWAVNPEAASRIARESARDAELAAADAARKIRVAALKTQARDVQKALKARAANAPADLQAAIETLGFALPLRFKNDRIEDAGGRMIATSHYELATELRTPALRLLALGLNAALGFAATDPAVIAAWRQADEAVAGHGPDDDEPDADEGPDFDGDPDGGEIEP